MEPAGQRGAGEGAADGKRKMQARGEITLCVNYKPLDEWDETLGPFVSSYGMELDEANAQPPSALGQKGTE